MEGYGSVVEVVLPPVELVGSTVLVVVVGAGTEPVDQKTLCLTSAP